MEINVRQIPMNVWVNRAGMEARARTTSTATRASVCLGLGEPTARPTSMNAPRGELHCAAALRSHTVCLWLEVSPIQKQFLRVRICFPVFCHRDVLVIHASKTCLPCAGYQLKDSCLSKSVFCLQDQLEA